MKHFIKKILFKLSEYTFMRKIASKIFIRFPKVKLLILHFFYSSPTGKNMQNIRYGSDLLDTIKKEVEMHREKGL